VDELEQAVGAARAMAIQLLRMATPSAQSVQADPVTVRISDVGNETHSRR